MGDAENVLRDTAPGTYLLYKDFESDKIHLSVRVSNRIRHHRITEVNRLFYLEKQPYPYLDSIILYHRRHKLQGVKLKQQAQLSARVVKAFSQKIVAANGNLPPPLSTNNVTPQPPSHRISRSGSLTSLITSSSDSTTHDGVSAHWQTICATLHQSGPSQEGDFYWMPQSLRIIPM